MAFIRPTEVIYFNEEENLLETTEGSYTYSEVCWLCETDEDTKLMEDWF